MEYTEHNCLMDRPATNVPWQILRQNERTMWHGYVDVLVKQSRPWQNVQSSGNPDKPRCTIFPHSHSVYGRRHVSVFSYFCSFRVINSTAAFNKAKSARTLIEMSCSYWFVISAITKTTTINKYCEMKHRCNPMQLAQVWNRAGLYEW